MLLSRFRFEAAVSKASYRTARPRRKLNSLVENVANFSSARSYVKIKFIAFLTFFRFFSVAIQLRKAQCGAVTFIQRFGSALNLNLHLHALVKTVVRSFRCCCTCGVVSSYVPPELRSVARLLHRQRRGLGPDSDPEESDPLSRDQPLRWRASTRPPCQAR